MSEAKWLVMMLVSFFVFTLLMLYVVEGSETKQLEACTKAGMEYSNGECVR